MRIGVSLTPNAEDHEKLVELAVAADGAGLDLIGIQDHPYQRRFLDTWMLIADLLARTKRVSIFPDVANLPLRPPAMMAKAAMSLDAMSGGRFELGLGAGAAWDRVATMGGPRRSPGEGVDALREAMYIVRLSWSGEESVSYEGRYYSVDGFEPGPPPAHPIGIWVGAYKPRMLRLVGTSPTAGSRRSSTRAPRRRAWASPAARSTGRRRPPGATRRTSSGFGTSAATIPRSRSPAGPGMRTWTASCSGSTRPTAARRSSGSSS